MTDFSVTKAKLARHMAVTLCTFLVQNEQPNPHGRRNDRINHICDAYLTSLFT
jgi:hypothetical protein